VLVLAQTTEAVAKQNGFSIAKGLQGHGVGTEFHMPPLILHYKNDRPGLMQAGNIFTIEPIFVQVGNMVFAV